MGKQRKVQMRVSIASADWSYQPDQVVMLDRDLAEKWIAAGHAVAVNGNLPLTDFNSLDGLADLDAEQALHMNCSACGQRRAQFVFRNKPYCPWCYRAESES